MIAKAIMTGNDTHRITLFFLAAILMIGVPTLHAQSTSVDTQETAVTVEWLKPNLEGVSSSFLSSVLFVTARLPISKTITLAADLGIAYFDGGSETFDFDREAGSSMTTGNPYVGIEVRKRKLPISAELGLRLPLGTGLSSRAAFIAMAAETERFDAFTDHDILIKTRLHYRRNFRSVLMVHARAGWSGGHSVKQDGGPGNFSTFDYGIRLGYHIQQVNLTGGLSGRYLLDGSTFHMSRFSHTGIARTTNRFTVAASIDYRLVRPGAYLSYLLVDYVNDRSRNIVGGLLTDEVRFVFGLSLAVKLR